VGLTSRGIAHRGEYLVVSQLLSEPVHVHDLLNLAATLFVSGLIDEWGNKGVVA
jgi:hypothetical protein